MNRNKLFRLLSALTFFSGCVSAGDHTLFLYYVEENFGFNDKDVAMLFLLIGVMGIVVQSVILKPLNSLIGERRVIMVAFIVGALHNFLYGIAQSKKTMFISASIASLTGMSFPTISAIKANNVVSFVTLLKLCTIVHRLISQQYHFCFRRMNWNKEKSKVRCTPCLL